MRKKHGLFKMMVWYMKRELEELNRENVILKVTGDWHNIPSADVWCGIRNDIVVRTRSSIAPVA